MTNTQGAELTLPNMRKVDRQFDAAPPVDVPGEPPASCWQHSDFEDPEGIRFESFRLVRDFTSSAAFKMDSATYPMPGEARVEYASIWGILIVFDAVPVYPPQPGLLHSPQGVHTMSFPMDR